MVKGLKDENAPKRPLSAYIQWQATVRDSISKTMPGASVGDMAKAFAEKWGAMSDAQKKPFQTKYAAEKEKFDKKWAKYKTTKEYATFQKKKEEHKFNSVKNKKFKRDENAPSRPSSAYFLFMADERDELVAGGMAHKEALSKLGEMWGNLSAAKKKPYQDKAAIAKAKWEKQVEKYRKTATYKNYLKEKDEFYAQRKADLKALEGRSKSRSKSSKPKAPKRSASKSRSKKRSARKASKPKAPKRSVSRSKSARRASKPKKAKSRSRSRSKSKARKATRAKKSRSRSKSKGKKKARKASRSRSKAKVEAPKVKAPAAPVAEPMDTETTTTEATA